MTKSKQNDSEYNQNSETARTKKSGGSQSASKEKKSEKKNCGKNCD